MIKPEIDKDFIPATSSTFKGFVNTTFVTRSREMSYMLAISILIFQ